MVAVISSEFQGDKASNQAVIDSFWFHIHSDGGSQESHREAWCGQGWPSVLSRVHPGDEVQKVEIRFYCIEFLVFSTTYLFPQNCPYCWKSWKINRYQCNPDWFEIFLQCLTWQKFSLLVVIFDIWMLRLREKSKCSLNLTPILRSIQSFKVQKIIAKYYNRSGGKFRIRKQNTWSCLFAAAGGHFGVKWTGVECTRTFLTRNFPCWVKAVKSQWSVAAGEFTVQWRVAVREAGHGQEREVTPPQCCQGWPGGQMTTKYRRQQCGQYFSNWCSSQAANPAEYPTDANCRTMLLFLLGTT